MINTDSSYQPLVSVLVITYNSSRFVLETLESVKVQTYKNIELIISDDCSNDNTVDLCNIWLENNKNLFCKAEIVTSSTNTGVPANLNRGLAKANGIWIKGIAGDDLLAKDCIFQLLEFVRNRKEEIKILSSDMIIFSGSSPNSGTISKNQNTWFCSNESTAREQFQLLIRSNRVFAATVIIKRELLQLMNGYDERYRLLEDWPLWIKITELGFKIFHVDQPLIYYRTHDKNLSQTSDTKFLYNPIYNIDLKFRKKELVPRLPFIEAWGLIHRIIGIKLCFRLGNDKNKFLARFVHDFSEFFNPYNIFQGIYKMIGIKYKNSRYF